MGFYGPGKDGGVGAEKDFFDVFPPSKARVWRASLEEGFWNTIEPYYLEGLYHPRDPATDLPFEVKPLSEEEFNEKGYAGEGLEYDHNLTEVAAEHIIKRRKQRETNEYIISKGKGGIVELVGEVGIKAAMSLLDPITVITALTPIGSASLWAKSAKHLGKFGTIVVQGMAGGAIGQAVVEPVHAYGKHLAQEDYSFKESAANIATSSLGGGMLTGGIYCAKKLINSWKMYKTNNTLIDRELEKHFHHVTKNHNHPEGIKFDVKPIEELQKEKLELFKEYEQKFPDIAKKEQEVIELETLLNHEYFTNNDEGLIPDDKLELLNSKREELYDLKKSLNDNQDFLLRKKAQEDLNKEIIESIKLKQYQENAYDLNIEDLHIAKSQLEEGKAINLKDPKNASSIYELDKEHVEFNNVDEELKSFYAEELKTIDLTDPEIKSKVISDMRVRKAIDYIKTNDSIKVGSSEWLHQTELRQKTISRKYLCDFHLELQKTGLASHFEEMKGPFGLSQYRNKNLELDVIKELWNLTTNQHPHGYTNSKIALNLANLIHKYQKIAVDNANKNGANIAWLDGYITRQTHSSKAISDMGFESWRDFIVPLLDMEKTGDIDLREVFLNIKTGLHSFFLEGDLVPHSSNTSNLARKLGEERKLHFASPESWHMYNEKCGEYKFADSATCNLNRLGQATGLLEGLGNNPRDAISKLKAVCLEDLKQKSLSSNKIAENDMAFLQSNKLDNILDNMIGMPSANINLAQMAQNIRTMKTMGSLGRIVLSSVPDVAFFAQELSNNGIPLLKGYSHVLTDVSRNMTSKEKREFGRYLGIASDSILGTVYNRLHGEDFGSGIISKMSHIFFKFTGIEIWDGAHKTAIGTILSHNLARYSVLPYKSVPQELKIMLERYGISQGNWGLLKSMLQKHEGIVYIIHEGDNSLAYSVRRYLLDRAETGVVTAGAKEKAIMFQGIKTGTPLGEVLRFLWQFKSYPLGVMTKALKSATINKIPLQQQTGLFWTDLGKSLQSGGVLQSITHLTLMTTALGYVSMWGKNTSKGIDTPSFTEKPVDVFWASLSHGGGLGLFGDYLFNEYDRYGKNVWQHFAGPVFGDLTPPMVLLSKLKKGEMTEEDVMRTIKSYRTYILGQNLFYLERTLPFMWKKITSNSD